MFEIEVDLALNNLQWLMCHKTKLKQPNYLNPRALRLVVIFNAQPRVIKASMPFQGVFVPNMNFIIFTQPLCSGRIWHKVNFLSGVSLVWIQSFPSPRLVASPRLKNLVWMKENELYSTKRVWTRQLVLPISYN